MKKNLLMKSMCGLAVVVLMTSCVAKKKYTEAQNQISQLQAENARLTETGTTMQQNLTTLETQNRTLQSSLDSTNTWVSGQQTRWNSFQAFYDEGTKTVEQVHQQLHQQMDELIGAENITTSNGRVHVNLSEKTLFASGSSRLSTKGTQILETIAQAIKDNPNVEIDIASAPGYYMAGTMSDNTAMTTDNNTMNNQSTTSNSTTTQNSTATTNADNSAKMKTDADGDMKYKDANAKVKMDRDGDVKVKTSGTKSSSYSGAAKSKSTAYKSTARRSESKSKSYSSSPARKSSVSSSSKWSLNMARSSSIAKKLVDEGVAKSRILVAKDNDNTSGTKDYQIIISPKSDTYYQSIGNGSGTNSGMNK